MVNIDVRYIQKEINYYGNTVTIRTVSKDVSSSKWGDAVETTVDVPNIKCTVYTINEADTNYREAGFKAGDMIFFFDYSSEQYMVNGNRILYAGHWYEMYHVKPWRIVDTTYSFEVYTHKI